MATVVAFHAHPDDEVILTGGTLARAAAAGHRVVVVTATDGRVHDADEDVRIDEQHETESKGPRLCGSGPRQGGGASTGRSKAKRVSLRVLVIERRRRFRSCVEANYAPSTLNMPLKCSIDWFSFSAVSSERSPVSRIVR